MTEFFVKKKTIPGFFLLACDSLTLRHNVPKRFYRSMKALGHSQTYILIVNNNMPKSYSFAELYGRPTTGTPANLDTKFLRTVLYLRVQHTGILGCFRSQWRKVPNAVKGNCSLSQMKKKKRRRKRRNRLILLQS